MIFSRFCNTVSVYLYQATVFYTQMVLVEELVDCSDPERCTLRGVYGNRMTWLVIETSAFYLYALATVIYIAAHMIKGACETPDPHSDRAKAMSDFIVYTSMNLTWFALNFVLVTMPPLCIFWLNKYDSLVRKRFEGTYAPIMYLTWLTNITILVSKRRVISIKNMGIGQLNEADIIESSFGKDDSFKPKGSASEGKEEAGPAGEEKGKSLLPSDKIKVIPFLEHYIEMDSVIDFDCIKIQILQVVMILVSITLYVKIEGRELVYAMYIPLDIALNACTFCFFWLYYYKDKSNTEDTIRVA